MEFQNICNEVVAPFLLRHPVHVFVTIVSTAMVDGLQLFFSCFVLFLLSFLVQYIWLTKLAAWKLLIYMSNIYFTKGHEPVFSSRETCIQSIWLECRRKRICILCILILVNNDMNISKII